MPRRKRGISSKSPFRVRLLWFIPLTMLLLERLWIPLRMSLSASPTHFNLDTIASTQEFKRVHQSAKVPRLDDVTKNSGDWMKCPAKSRMIENHKAEQLPGSRRNFPMFIHQTGETKCLSQGLYKACSTWKVLGLDYYFHDQIAVNRLLNVDFPEFPLLPSILRCVYKLPYTQHLLNSNFVNHPRLFNVRCCIRGFEGKVSLWKYLVLYTYGGIFASLGSAPDQRYRDGTLFMADDDAKLFVGHDRNSLTPDLISVSAKHPLIYYAIHHYILEILRATEIGEVSLYRSMSLHAMHAAVGDFTRDAGVNSTSFVIGKVLLGTDNRTLVVLGEEEENGLTFENVGSEYKDTFDSHQSQWEGSCMSAILSDLG